MARISRKCYEASFYHIMVQGIKRENIFKNDNMKEYYIRSLKEKSDEYKTEIVAYCIMNNHVHILLHVEKIELLTKIMSSVNTKFAKYYNKQNNRIGYVYRDRYRCENIFTENHLINCVKYIHNNPVKARISALPSEYKYSSYNEYLNSNLYHQIITENKEVLKYKDMFLNGYYDESLNFIDDDNEFGNAINKSAEEIIKDYILNNNIKLNELTDTEIFYLSKKILKNCQISKTGLARKLNVERTRWYRIMRMHN